MTNGQAAYEVPKKPDLSWDQLSEKARQEWEARAQAVMQNAIMNEVMGGAHVTNIANTEAKGQPMAATVRGPDEQPGVARAKGLVSQARDLLQQAYNDGAAAGDNLAQEWANEYTKVRDFMNELLKEWRRLPVLVGRRVINERLVTDDLIWLEKLEHATGKALDGYKVVDPDKPQKPGRHVKGFEEPGL